MPFQICSCPFYQTVICWRSRKIKPPLLYCKRLTSYAYRHSASLQLFDAMQCRVSVSPVFSFFWSREWENLLLAVVIPRPTVSVSWSCPRWLYPCVLVQLIRAQCFWMHSIVGHILSNVASLLSTFLPNIVDHHRRLDRVHRRRSWCPFRPGVNY